MARGYFERRGEPIMAARTLPYMKLNIEDINQAVHITKAHSEPNSLLAPRRSVCFLSAVDTLRW